MKLNKLYTVPKELFPPIEFHSGINFIFGRKEIDVPEDSKRSLNRIGKSTLIDLIDYALLCHKEIEDKPRLYKAFNKGILKDCSVVLEFSISGIEYLITRSFNDDSIIFLQENNGPREKITFDNCTEELFQLIFQRDDYPGTNPVSYYRQMMNFFIKVHKSNKFRYDNPIKYLADRKFTAYSIIHLFLLGIDNTIPFKALEIEKHKSFLENRLKEITRIVREEFKKESVEDLRELKNSKDVEIELLRNELKAKEDKSFSGKIRRKILRLQEEKNGLEIANILDSQTLQSYKNTFINSDNIKPEIIYNIYSNYNEIFAVKAKKSIEDFKKFYEYLSLSRRIILKEEINRLENKISENLTELDLINVQIKQYIYSSKESSLLDSYAQISNTLGQLKAENDRISRIISEYNKSSTALADIEIKLIELRMKLNSAIEDLNYQSLKFIAQLNDLHKALYNESMEEYFSVSHSDEEQTIVDINLMTSSSSLNARSLVYDLSVLLYTSENNFNAPHFLIHDNIFDGVDKAHLITLIEYLEQKQNEGVDFQYILALNEEGRVDEDFGNNILLEPDNLSELAAIVLTPKQTLFGVNY